MAESPLDVAGLDGDARLAHDLGALADPDQENELDSRALRVVGVLDPHVRVLGLAIVQLRRELLQPARPRPRQHQLVAHGPRVREKQPVSGVLVGPHGVVRRAYVGGVEAGHCGRGVVRAGVGSEG